MPSPTNPTGPLLKDHGRLRELMGELKASVDAFHLPGIRKVVIELYSMIEAHSLKEDSGLYLIGMKLLRADNKVLPNLMAEHRQTLHQFHDLIRLLYSPRLTAVEDHVRNLAFTILDDLEHHLSEEEQTVFPAFERLLAARPDLIQIVLDRYRAVESEEDEELERTPLISLPPLDPQSPTPLPEPKAAI